MEVRVAGTVRNVPDRSFTVTDAVEERSVCRFEVDDVPGALEFTKGQAVEIYDGASLVFAGVVDSAEERVVSPEGRKVHRLRVADWHYLADKRLAARSYEETPAGTIVADLVTRYLAAEGVTAGTIAVGPTIREAVFNYVPVSAALDELAEKAGVTWWVGPDKDLQFVERTTNTAPWTLTGDDVIGDEVDVERGNAAYRNRQYLRGGVDVTDPQSEQRQGDGKTRAWPMAYSLAKVPTVTVNGAARTVGIRGVETGRDFYWNKGDPEISQDESAAPLTSTDTLGVTYQGEYAIIALAEDPGAVADRQTVEGTGTGYVEHVIDEPQVSSREAAFESAKAKLERYATIGRKLRFATDRAGLRPGQLLTVDLPPHGFVGDALLIAAVDTYVHRGQLRWKVTAVEGPVIGSWARFFGDLVRKAGQYVDLVNVGGGDILALLTSISERAGWTELVTQATHACPVPSATLYPATDLYPC